MLFVMNEISKYKEIEFGLCNNSNMTVDLVDKPVRDLSARLRWQSEITWISGY